MMSVQDDNRSDQAQWTVKGWHVLAALLTFFGVMMSSNAVFVYFALTSFNGVETRDAYRRGLDYNSQLADARSRATLGWRADLTVSERRFELTVVGSDDQPINGLAIDARAGRPATDHFDRPVIFTQAGPGLYRSASSDFEAGAWVVALDARDPDRQSGDVPTFRYKERIWMPR